MPPSPHVKVGALVGAPAQTVRGIVADYRVRHPRIPPPAFRSVEVESGGVGAGTIVRVEMRVMGRSSALRLRVEEPVPGRVLREVDDGSGTVTTFTFAPEGDAATRVTIETTWAPKPGLRGRIEGWMMARVARLLYRDELKRLDAYARASSRPASPG